MMNTDFSQTKICITLDIKTPITPIYAIMNLSCDTCLKATQRVRIRLATYEGSLTKTPDLYIRIFSLMNAGVHTEIWFNNFRIAAIGGESRQNCLEIQEMDPGILDSPQGWHIVELPIHNGEKALDFISKVRSLPIRYDINVAECSLPKYCLDQIDQDLDCCHPETWDSLFCSQFALLFLRYCSKQGMLRIPKQKEKLLWSVNSKGCLPSRLQIITDRIFGAQT